MRTRDVAAAGLMIALVFVVTRAFIVPIPQTRGFFNLGEAAIYMASVLFGPVVGALSGGLGSALADLSLGYSQYAPYTLVIKGVEGAVVGLFAQRLHPAGWLAALVAGIAALWLVATETWLVRLAGAAIVLAVAGAIVGARSPAWARTGARLSGMLGGGLLMVAGYFVTQAYIFGLGRLPAMAEVPYNLVQVAVGIVIGLAAAAALERALPGATR